MRGRGLSKERGGPVAVNHSLTFCCVKTLSNTHRIECSSLQFINSRAESLRINAASFVSLPHSRNIEN